MTTTYEVIATIKSPSSDPVEVSYHRGDSHVAALGALVQAASEDPTDYAMPTSIRTQLLSVRLDITKDDLPPGYRWATEGEMDRPDAIVVPRSVDSQGSLYTQDEADVAVPVAPAIAYQADWDEGSKHSLSECCWHDKQYQPWARLDCWGRMAVIHMVVDGIERAVTPICEGHFNAYPATTNEEIR